MKQITIVTENRTGVVADVTEALAGNNINIETLDAEAVDDSGIIILTVDRYDEALQVLSQIPDIQAVSEEAILIRLEDKPGALAQIARRFHTAQIGLRSIRILKRDPPNSVVAISTERTAEALELVKDLLIA